MALFLIPFDGIEVDPSELPEKELSAINTFLAEKRGEPCTIAKMWSSKTYKSYFVLIDTQANEPTVTIEVTLEKIAAIMSR